MDKPYHLFVNSERAAPTPRSVLNLYWGSYATREEAINAKIPFPHVWKEVLVYVRATDGLERTYAWNNESGVTTNQTLEEWETTT